MLATEIIEQQLNKFYNYLIKKGYRKSIARRYMNVVKFLIEENINPLNFEEVKQKLKDLKKSKNAIACYLSICKRYKEFINEYIKEDKKSAKHKYYLTKDEVYIVLQVLLKIARMYNISVKCMECDRNPKCDKKCLIETTTNLAKELLIHLNGRV